MADIRFDGRVAVITGAGGGLGRTYALEIARRGGKVLVNDLGGKADGTGAGHSMADAVVKEITEAGGEAIANYDSVSTPEGGEAMIQAALERFGTVDVVINNAGILRDKTFAKLTPDELGIVLDVHLKGAFYVTQPAFRNMRRTATAASSSRRRAPASSATSARPTTAPRRWASSASRTCSPRKA